MAAVVVEFVGELISTPLVELVVVVHYKFYEQCGYRLTDEVYEGGRHGWLIKDLILGSEN